MSDRPNFGAQWAAKGGVSQDMHERIMRNDPDPSPDRGHYQPAADTPDPRPESLYVKVGRISEAGISLDDPRPVSPPSEFPRRMDDEEMRALAKLLRARVADSRGVQLWGDLALIVADTLDAARAAPQADAGTLREAAITTVCDLLWANGVYMKDSQPLATAIVDVLCGAALGAPSHATAGRDDG